MKHLISLILLLVSASFVLAEDETQSLYPSPENVRVLPSNDILYRRDYRQVLGALDIFDAPNGNLLRSRPAGTFFVSVNTYQEGWAEINTGEWIHAEQLAPAPISSLGGVLLDGETEYPLGFLHENVIPRSTAGGEIIDPNFVIPEYRIVYIFGESIVDEEAWVQIGEAQWIRRSSVRLVEPIARPADVTSQRWVGVDVAQQVIIAYEGERAVFATLVSTGQELTPTTTGVFDTYARFNPRDMSRGRLDEPFFYHMEDVPYTFYFNGNQALHGAYWHNNFGNRQSHGCINMSLSDAYWLYAFFSETLNVADPNAVWSQVYVYHQE